MESSKTPTLEELNKCAIIIQARMSSSRFPGKMMTCLNGSMPLIEYLYERCRNSSVKNILIATSEDKSDDELYDYCKKNNISVMRGSLNNVLERYIQAAESTGADYIVRVCGDTPFVDISLTDVFLGILIYEKLDYVSADRRTCSSAFYSETVTLRALKEARSLTDNKEDFEHVTKYIIDHREEFLVKFLDVRLNPAFMKGLRLTIDYFSDLQLVGRIIDRLNNKLLFSSKEILNIISRKEVCL